ncbi:hypothetical protein FACS1894132_03580 [Clostridia bacterium]|nr:hypothetical protein FACS1894132_03580 [Clostridia bacterium]
MIKLKKLKKRTKIILISLFSLIFTYFALSVSAWYYQTYKLMYPLMDNHKSEWHIVEDSAPFSHLYEYRVGKTLYELSVHKYSPFRLTGGNLGVTTDNVVTDNYDGFTEDYAIGMLMWPSIFRDFRYVITIDDLEKSTEEWTEETANVVVEQYWYDVDENLNLTDDKSKYTDRQLQVWTNAHDDVVKFFDETAEFYGRDHFFK